MATSTALLVISNIKQLAKSLKAISQQHVTSLYIHLNIPATNVQPAPTWGRLISQVYADSSLYCGHGVDMRILVGPLKKATYSGRQLRQPIDVIYADNSLPELCESLRQHLNVASQPIYLHGDPSRDTAMSDIDGYQNSDSPHKVYDTVVLGGTFDRIHIGHKIFLTQAVLRACRRLVVGVTTEKLTKGKTLPELILPVEERIRQLREFLMEIDASLLYEVVPIDDPFGPTQTDPDMDLIVVSAETLRGGEKVNEVRRAKNLRPLEIFCIDVVECNATDGPKETKVSSSNTRIDLLGTRLRKPKARPHLPKKPYIIGLTGGIASGKSKMSQRFEAMGAVVMDCDKIAHEIYEPGQECYNKVVAHFGRQILDASARIDRVKLGSIVFSDSRQLETLNGLVWPELMAEVKRRIATTAADAKVVVVEAAVLLKAGWERECHEVWSMIVPPEVAVQRVMQRNGLSEEEARKRLASQLDNSEMVAHSNVVLSSQWDDAFTQYQAEKAWRLLMHSLDHETKPASSML